MTQEELDALMAGDFEDEEIGEEKTEEKGAACGGKR